MTPAQLDQQITFLYTHDLEATSKFYADCLGLEMVLMDGTVIKLGGKLAQVGAGDEHA